MYADNVIQAMVKCLKSEHRALKKVPVPIFCCVDIYIYIYMLSLFNLNLVILQDAAWALSNIAAGSIEVKRMIYSSEAMPLLLRFLTAAPLDLRKEVAHVIGHVCVVPSEGSGRPDLIVDHLVSLVRQGCLGGFIDLVRSADPEAATLGIQLMELVSNTIILF